MDSLLVRGAKDGDLPALTELYNHYVRTSPATFDLEPASLGARRQWMGRYADAGPHRLLVAVDGGSLAGYATSGKLREKPGYLTSVETTVYPHRAYAVIVLPNPVSIALHARFGFEPVGLFREAGRKFGH